MYPRTNYEMSEEDLKDLLNCMQPVPCIKIGSFAPSSQQENANNAWKSLGIKMGFDSATVQPIAGKGNRFFSAVPSETEEQKKERELQEIKNIKIKKIANLKKEIDSKREELKQLED